MTELELDRLDWAKGDGLIPVIVQDQDTLQVLMLGYMNREAAGQTLRSGQVSFYSRSRQRLWRKGEASGHVLDLVSIAADCDNDTLLVRARPAGPTCHRGTTSCFGNEDAPGVGWLARTTRAQAPAVTSGENSDRVVERAADLLGELLKLLAAARVPIVRVVELLRQRAP